MAQAPEDNDFGNLLLSWKIKGITESNIAEFIEEKKTLIKMAEGGEKNDLRNFGKIMKLEEYYQGKFAYQMMDTYKPKQEIKTKETIEIHKARPDIEKKYLDEVISRGLKVKNFYYVRNGAGSSGKSSSNGNVVVIGILNISEFESYLILLSNVHVFNFIDKNKKLRLLYQSQFSKFNPKDRNIDGKENESDQQDTNNETNNENKNNKNKNKDKDKGEIIFTIDWVNNVNEEEYKKSKKELSKVLPVIWRSASCSLDVVVITIPIDYFTLEKLEDIKKLQWKEFDKPEIESLFLKMKFDLAINDYVIVAGSQLYGVTNPDVIANIGEVDFIDKRKSEFVIDISGKPGLSGGGVYKVINGELKIIGLVRGGTDPMLIKAITFDKIMDLLKDPFENGIYLEDYRAINFPDLSDKEKTIEKARLLKCYTRLILLTKTIDTQDSVCENYALLQDPIDVKNDDFSPSPDDLLKKNIILLKTTSSTIL